MCGIFANLGSRSAVSTTLKGLKLLEYRGYDSFGFAWENSGHISTYKQLGRIHPPKPIQPSRGAIGHTRWATHGSVSLSNTHPLVAPNQSFALVHNGMVENAPELTKKLTNLGYTFSTQTDTEVILNLILHHLSNSLAQAITATFKQLQGRNAIVLLSSPASLYFHRHGSPLVMGYHTRKQHFSVASDAASLVSSSTHLAPVLADKTYTVNLTNLPKLAALPYNFQPAPSILRQSPPKPSSTFLFSEISQTPKLILNQLNHTDSHLSSATAAINKARRVLIVGSGSAGVAAQQTAFYLRQIAAIPAISLVSSEFHSWLPTVSNRDVIIAISQSGETADLLESIAAFKTLGTKVISCINMPYSQLATISDHIYPTPAGPERSVISSKVFTAQLTFGFLLAHSCANSLTKAISQLRSLATTLEHQLSSSKLHQHLKKLASLITTYQHILILGHHEFSALSQEAMIKLIESTYLHAHSIPAADLKHYALSLIDQDILVIVLSGSGSSHHQISNAVSQLNARHARILSLGTNSLSHSADQLIIPNFGLATPIFAATHIQLLAYYASSQLGHDVDHPRHLAKSVTVV